MLGHVSITIDYEDIERWLAIYRATEKIDIFPPMCSLTHLCDKHRCFGTLPRTLTVSMGVTEHNIFLRTEEYTDENDLMYKRVNTFYIHKFDPENTPTKKEFIEAVKKVQSESIISSIRRKLMCIDVQIEVDV